MSEKIKSGAALVSLRRARRELLASQIALLDLAKLSANEAALLDSEEKRAERLAQSLGLPQLQLDESLALLGAAGAFARAIAEERDRRDTSTSPKGPPEGEDGEAARAEVATQGEPETTEQPPDPLSNLLATMSAAGLSDAALVNVIASWAQIRDEKSRSGLMLESLLLSAVAQFEVFVSRLISSSLKFDPSIINDSERKFSFKEVTDYESIDSFSSAVADLFIDSLMYKGMEAWMKFLSRATRVETAWVGDLLEEVVMRRNVHVHSGGRASAQYLDALGKNAAAVKVGDDLPVTEAYLEDALNRMARAAIVLSQAAVAAVCRDGRVAAAGFDLKPDSGVVDVSLDLLAAGRYAAVAPLADQLMTLVVNNSTKERLRANSLWAKKKLLGTGAVRSEIEAWDVSSSEDELKLAKHCLLDETDVAVALYKNLVEAKKLTPLELATWPILEAVRTAMSADAA